MLWARDIRRELSLNADHDFATISRKLGEMWANVPSNEKYNWRRRAKRLAAKGKERIESGTPAKVSTSTTKFINHSSAVVAASPSRSMRNQGKVGITTLVEIKPMVGGSLVPGLCSGVKISGTSPVDVAAHLKLLGDSLTTIGERLKEHEVIFSFFDFLNHKNNVFNFFSICRDKLWCLEAFQCCWTVCYVRWVR